MNAVGVATTRGVRWGSLQEVPARAVFGSHLKPREQSIGEQPVSRVPSVKSVTERAAAGQSPLLLEDPDPQDFTVGVRIRSSSVAPNPDPEPTHCETQHLHNRQMSGKLSS